jgi:hypothetical protein
MSRLGLSQFVSWRAGTLVSRTGSLPMRASPRNLARPRLSSRQGHESLRSGEVADAVGIQGKPRNSD